MFYYQDMEGPEIGMQRDACSTIFSDGEDDDLVYL